MEANEPTIFNETPNSFTDQIDTLDLLEASPDFRSLTTEADEALVYSEHGRMGVDSGPRI